jgi:hypothetical protein
MEKSVMGPPWRTEAAAVKDSRLTFTGGGRNGITRAHGLIEGIEPDAVIADKGI